MVTGGVISKYLFCWYALRHKKLGVKLGFSIDCDS